MINDKTTQLFGPETSQKVSTVIGIGGSWSRDAELSSLLDSPVALASQKCQQSQGSVGVVVAKRRTVPTFALVSRRRVSRRRVSKVSAVTSRECNVYVSSRGSCRNAKVDSARRSWKDLSGMSRQKVLNGCPESKQERAPPCLHAFGFVAPVRGAYQVFYSWCGGT